MFIVTGLIKNIKHDQQAGRKSNCQSKNVDKRKHLVPGKASECNLKIILYHHRAFIKSRTNCFSRRWLDRNDEHPTSNFQLQTSNIKHQTSNFKPLASPRSQ